MKKIYHLASCSTCVRIIKELDPDSNYELQDIKSNKITEEQIEEMHALSNSYEDIFSRKAMKYRAMNLGEKDLSEAGYRQLILDEYTFLKRPVIIINDQIFIGNSKKNVELAKAAM
ncbi:MAG: hypothetical protein HRT71_12740 [Flavobacteriales bacterium]|nr:hypothetical protein [Flavobacteriales bacterium]